MNVNALSQLRICRPPPSILISLLWMMGSVLNSMGRIIKKFSYIYFSSYREKFIENWRFLEQKWRIMTITRKIKIGKIWNLIFLFIQPIAVLSCKFDHFWRIFLFWCFLDFFQSKSIFFFKRGQIYMKDLESAEYKEKRNFRFFRYLFFEFLWKIPRKFGWRRHKNDHNSKNKNRKNRKFGFSFYPTDSRSFM